MNELEILLPEKVSTNVYYRTHFRRRSEMHQEFYVAVDDAVRRAGTAPVEEYPVRMHYSFELHGTPLDNLNLSAMAKMLEDGLRHAGILREDTPAEVAEVSLSQCAFRVKQAKVTIRWESASPARASTRRRAGGHARA